MHCIWKKGWSYKSLFLLERKKREKALSSCKAVFQPLVPLDEHKATFKQQLLWSLDGSSRSCLLPTLRKVVNNEAVWDKSSSSGSRPPQPREQRTWIWSRSIRNHLPWSLPPFCCQEVCRHSLSIPQEETGRWVTALAQLKGVVFIALAEMDLLYFLFHDTLQIDRYFPADRQFLLKKKQNEQFCLPMLRNGQWELDIPLS